MLHVLTESTIFIPQVNNCYLQLSGAPMDGLCTLAKIEEERRKLETMERKRKAKEEARLSRKKRKTGNGSKVSDQDDIRAVQRENDAEATAILAKANTRQKGLSRHTSTASASEGGVSLM